MRLRYAVAALLLTAAFIPLSAFGQTFFTAHLTPEQETGEVESDGSGTAAFVLTDEGLRYFVTLDGLNDPIDNAHFHIGEAGVSGGVVRGIMDSFEGNTASGIWTAADDEALTDELILDLFAGNLYLNIHTSSYPGGELRGQIYPSGGTALRGTLTAEQSTGEVDSGGSGTAALQLTDAGVLFFLTVDGLTGGIDNAHFHEAEIGLDGGIVRGIAEDFDGNTAFGLWTSADDEPLTDDLIATLLGGGLYINVHTAAYPGGEIRGQLFPADGWGFHAALDAEQSTGDVESDGSGTGTFTLTEAGLLFHITIDSLTGPYTNAHFHRAPAGEDGGVVRGILDDFDGNTAAGIWRASDDEPLTDELIRDLHAGNLYINVHTEDYPGGEIRGQVLSRPGAELSARLTAGQEPGVVESDGRGTAAMSLTDDGLAFQVTVSGLTGEVANAHFHREAIGVDGGVVRGIAEEFDGSTAMGVWTSADDEPLTDELIQALLTGELYINIHTGEYPGGEIRGQVLLAEGTALRAFLTNEQSLSGVEQEGSGTAAMTLTDQGLVFDMTVTGLSGDINNAHFHRGFTGIDGGVVRGIAADLDGNTATGLWTSRDGEALTDELIEALMEGELYLNVHTTANPGGEIRGQVIPGSGIGAAVQLDAEQSGEDIISDGTGTAALTLSHGGLAFALTATGLTGEIANAHFHEAPLGQDGGVVRGIFDDFAGNTALGFWRPSDDEPLTDELLGQLLAGNIYINLHTGDYPGGEIRGQVHPGGIVATSVEPVSSELPAAFRLEQNYPNPFNPATTIEFALADAARTTLTIYDALGRKVADLVDERLTPGTYRVRFDGRGLPSGVYFYTLAAEDLRYSRSMLLLK